MMAPFAEDFRQSGMAEDDLDALVEQERHANREIGDGRGLWFTANAPATMATSVTIKVTCRPNV